MNNDTGAGAPTLIAEICTRHGNEPSALLEILHEIQDAVGCVPNGAPHLLGKILNLSRAEVHGVISFYHDFRAAPAGRVAVKMCRAEACQSMGALSLIEDICRRMDTPLGKTRADGGLTIEAVYCLGNCALSPAALVNGKPVGRADAARLETAIREASA